MPITAKSAEEMKKIAGEIAENFLIGKERKDNKAVVFALQGDLGSGKTTFSQGFLAYFGIKRATSPTFVIMKKYYVPKLKVKSEKLKAGRLKSEFNLYHIDCYRIHNSRDLSELNFMEIIDNSKNIVLIEWAERIKDILPENTIWIKFEHRNENERILEISD
jgi:tRNA threonylcarbamoyladenosine biosynthesis protein TsaE